MYAILESLVMYVLLECFWVVTLIRKKKGHVVSGRYVTTWGLVRGGGVTNYSEDDRREKEDNRKTIRET